MSGWVCMNIGCNTIQNYESKNDKCFCGSEMKKMTYKEYLKRRHLYDDGGQGVGFEVVDGEGVNHEIKM